MTRDCTPDMDEDHSLPYRAPVAAAHPNEAVESEDRADEARPLKRRKLNYTEEIVVMVGSEEQRFLVHKSIVTAKSGFFQKTSDGNIKEASEGIVRLPETEPEVFAIYMQWIYRDEIVLLEDDSIEADETANKQYKTTHKQYSLLTKLYVVADLLKDKALCNSVIDEFRGVWMSTMTGPNAGVVTRIWKSTPQGSKLRTFVLDVVCWQKDEGAWLEKNMHRLPSNFVADVALMFAKVLWDRSKITNPKTAPACTYHEHDATIPRCV